MMRILSFGNWHICTKHIVKNGNAKLFVVDAVNMGPGKGYVNS